MITAKNLNINILYLSIIIRKSRFIQNQSIRVNISVLIGKLRTKAYNIINVAEENKAIVSF